MMKMQGFTVFSQQVCFDMEEKPQGEEERGADTKNQRPSNPSPSYFPKYHLEEAGILLANILLCLV